MPVYGDVILTSGYGLRTSPTEGASSDHKGIDFVVEDDIVRSVGRGAVTDFGTDDSRGNWIEITQTDGAVATYMHMENKPDYFKIGDYIEAGQMIGNQGSTGVSTGEHIHFQVQDQEGNYYNPIEYLAGELSNIFSFEGTWDVTETSKEAFQTKAKETTKDIVMKIASTVVKFLVMLLVVVLAVVLFMKAFNIKLPI